MRTNFVGRKRLRGFGLLALVLAGLFWFLFRSEEQYCVVSEVVDGDTILCVNGLRVRLLGIDAPEAALNRRVEVQLKYFGSVEELFKAGKQAKKFLEDLAPPGTKLRLEYDVEKEDRYGRVLAYVWLPDGRMINEVLLREGYAFLLILPPNEKYREIFEEAHLDAQRNKRGLWKRTRYPSTSRISLSTFPSSSLKMPTVFIFA